MTQAHAGEYAGPADAFRTIYRNEGASALFSGVVPRTMWISLGGAIFFGVYEYVKARIKPAEDDDDS